MFRPADTDAAEILRPPSSGAGASAYRLGGIDTARALSADDADGAVGQTLLQAVCPSAAT